MLPQGQNQEGDEVSWLLLAHTGTCHLIFSQLYVSFKTHNHQTNLHPLLSYHDDLYLHTAAWL